MATARANAVSSFTIIKGSLVDETYVAFQHWDSHSSKSENLARIRESGVLTYKSDHWLRDVCWVISRRFDPAGRDHPLVLLAKGGCNREVWNPLLLWHMTRDEFLLRDFLTDWLYGRYRDGTYRIRSDDVVPYLRQIAKRRSVEVSETWSDSTTHRVATGLLRIATDFGLLKGTQVKEFASYHLPDESFLYLVHAAAEAEPNARKMIESPDWRMYLMDSTDVERELFRLHQYRRLGFEAAGSLAQLDLPSNSTVEFAEELAR